MSDYLIRALAQEGAIRAVAAITTCSVREAQRRHRAWPTATAALGRALTAVALVGSSLKFDDTLAMRFDGGGPLGGMLVEATGRGHLRGYVKNPHVDLDPTPDGNFDVARAVGRQGVLAVIQDLGLKEPYTGVSPLVSGEIGEDVASYMWTSEQIPSAVALGVYLDREGAVQAAGGYLLQTMPGVSQDEREQLEANLRALGGISTAIDAGTDGEALLERALRGFPYTRLERHPLAFRCRCSRARALSGLAGLSDEELKTMIREDRGAEMSCHFCAEIYQIQASELEELLISRHAPEA